jgi:hypothetical protein
LVAVYDVFGRAVREWRFGPTKQGELVVSWNGTDALGRLLPYGCYFARVEFGGDVATTKVFFVE